MVQVRRLSVVQPVVSLTSLRDQTSELIARDPLSGLLPAGRSNIPTSIVLRSRVRQGAKRDGITWSSNKNTKIIYGQAKFDSGYTIDIRMVRE